MSSLNKNILSSMNKTLYLQTAEYEPLKFTTNYHKSDGPRLKALGRVSIAKNVLWQAYHGQSVTGNHINKMLKVINSKLLLSSVIFQPFILLRSNKKITGTSGTSRSEADFPLESGPAENGTN